MLFMKKKWRILVTLVASTLICLPANGQTSITVPLSNDKKDVIAPPSCTFACTYLELPAFTRQLALAGPTGSYKTALTRRKFLDRMEEWRLFLEIYRQSIEQKQFNAPDWNKANITYKVELGLYDQFFESYRNAYQMDKAGTIIYGVDAIKTSTISQVVLPKIRPQ